MRRAIRPKTNVTNSGPRLWTKSVRQFIRHPTDVAIEISAGSQLDHALRHSRNVGIGGLAFESDQAIEIGMIIELRIPLVHPPFETTARVVWCQATAGGWELGVEFLHADDAFRARMVEQICHIEDYRKGVQRSEGRELTAEQAAMEWIGKDAANFPGGTADDGASEAG